MTTAETPDSIHRAPHRRSRAKALAAIAVLGGLFLALGQRTALADGVSATVSVDTSSLVGISGQFFVLTDGNTPTPGTNTATLSDFTFGTGGVGGAVDTTNTFGDITSGLNLADGATMLDDQFTNVFAGFFTAGNQLTFDLTLTANVMTGAPAPDEFALFVVDANGSPLASTDPDGSGSLLTVTIDSANPTVETFTDAVTVTSNTVPAPEPSAFLLLAAGLAALSALRMRMT
ncbi:MAG: NF038129 family PEP-CTERM protein [Candidatus Acidiferrales bacterium]